MQTRFHLWLARIISHEENALAILNGPALKWAAVAAALVMGLPILQQIPGITIAYICLVLIGVDVQYIACVRNAAEASSNKTRIMWSIVAGVLFIPVFQTNAVFSLHAQTGIDELSAMNMIHLSSTGWGIERALLIALLMGVSALSRPKQHSTIATVAPAPTPAPTVPDKPRRRRDPVLTLIAEHPSAVRTPRAPDQLASFENAAREAFSTGATSIDRMMRATGMGRTAAASWTRTLKAEAAAKKQKVA